MPAVIPLIVAWTQTSIVGWIFGAVVKMAAAYAISRALSPKPGKLGSMGNPITMSRDAAAARRVIYGQTRASGPIIFAHVTGTKNSDLHLVIALAGHKLAEIGQILINDEIVDLDVDGNATTSKYVGKLRVRKWLGDQTTSDALLVTESGGVWTSAHVCQGIACIYAKLVFDQDVFPQGIPNISAIVKGREVYDPRDESTAWTDNPALCALDYMRDTDVGFAATDAEIDYASYAAAASVCDEAVTLAVGGTEKRYRCAGVFATDGEPASIVEQLVGTMSGTMVYSGGKFSLKAGAYEIPIIEFDESHLRGPIQFQTDSSRREVCNIVKGTYTSPADLYQPRDFPQWVNSAAVTADEEEITRDLALDWVHSASQAQRLAAIEERASRLGGTIILQCNLSGLRVQVGDTITVKNARFGWTAGEVFKVIQFRFSAGEGAVGVDLTCRRTVSSVYAWSTASEVSVTPGSEPETGGGAYTIPGGGEETPGTYDDLIPGGPAGGYAPTWSIEDEKKDADAYLLGYEEYTSPSSPPDYYLTETIAGSTFADSLDGALWIWETAKLAGANTMDPVTGVVTSTKSRHYTKVIESMPPNINETTYSSAIGVESASLTDATATIVETKTVRTNTLTDYFLDEDHYTDAGGSATQTLSRKNTEEDEIARQKESITWEPNVSSYAYYSIRTARTIGWRMLRRRAESVIGLKPHGTYLVTFATETQLIGAVDTWVAGAPAVAAITADASGNAVASDWAELEAARGYEARWGAVTTISPQ